MKKLGICFGLLGGVLKLIGPGHLNLIGDGAAQLPGMGAGVTVGDLAGEIARIMDRPSLLRLQISGTVSEIVADTRRLGMDAGFGNRVPLAEGLAFAVQWWRERNFAP